MHILVGILSIQTLQQLFTGICFVKTAGYQGNNPNTTAFHWTFSSTWPSYEGRSWLWWTLGEVVRYQQSLQHRAVGVLRWRSFKRQPVEGVEVVPMCQCCFFFCWKASKKNLERLKMWSNKGMAVNPFFGVKYFFSQVFANGNSFFPDLIVVSSILGLGMVCMNWV